MILLLVLLPFLAGGLALLLPHHPTRRCLLVATALTELILTGICWHRHPEPIADILALDALGLLILTVTCLLFFMAALYAAGYLHQEEQPTAVRRQARLQFANVPEAVFTACLLFFLGAAVLVSVSHHLGLLWVAIEATTLASAPLIYFHRHQKSLEATWKYLIICSVGIALALLGNFLLDVAWQSSETNSIPMTLSAMLAEPGGVNPQWFKAAFIFIFIGYGTKMGLAPMHTWLPDAHSEAPSLVSALLSGALLNCAFLGIARVLQLSIAAQMHAFSFELCIIFGLFSMLIAALFIIGQTDYKRMLAYSSVEHMGILLLGVGVSGIASLGAMTHLIGHSLTKAAMFLLAGNILYTFRTKNIRHVSGLIHTLPRTGFLWLLGFLALTGAPPFMIFLSEFTVLRGLIAGGFTLPTLLYLLALGLVFIGMATACLRMVYGSASQVNQEQSESFIAFGPSLVLLSCSFTLGIWQPVWLKNLLSAAAQCLSALPLP